MQAPFEHPRRAGLARRCLDALAILCFLVVIAAPEIDFQVRPAADRSPEQIELRVPASKPPPPRTMSAVLAYPAHYDAWFMDSFGLRDKLLRWNSIVKVFGFGASPSKEVYFGKDHWIFYEGERSRENHRGAFPFPPDLLAAWAQALEQKRALLARDGIQYLYVVAPDKESVYREFLPDSMRLVGPTRLDQVKAYLPEHAPQVEFLDLRDVLIPAKAGDAEGEVYGKLGTHWSGRGSHVVLRALLERMNRMLGGGFVVEELDSYKRVEFQGSGDSWATRMYIDDLLPQPIHGFVAPTHAARLVSEGPFRLGRVKRTEIPGSDRPRVVLMHDSFGPHIETPLAEQCSWLECRWAHTSDLMDIAAAKPAIVVDMYVERTFNHLDPFKLVPSDRRPWPARFQLSRSTLLDVDRDSPTWGFTGQAGAVVGPAAEKPNPRLPIVVGEARDTLWIGPLQPVSGETPVLHVVIDSPRETDLLLWFKPPGRPDVVRRHMYRIPLVPGRNDVYEPLDKPGTCGELLLRPGQEAGTYLLRVFEVRSVAGS